MCLSVFVRFVVCAFVCVCVFVFVCVCDSLCVSCVRLCVFVCLCLQRLTKICLCLHVNRALASGSGEQFWRVSSVILHWGAQMPGYRLPAASLRRPYGMSGCGTAPGEGIVRLVVEFVSRRWSFSPYGPGHVIMPSCHRSYATSSCHAMSSCYTMSS